MEASVDFPGTNDSDRSTAPRLLNLILQWYYDEISICIHVSFVCLCLFNIHKYYSPLGTLSSVAYILDKLSEPDSWSIVRKADDILKGLPVLRVEVLLMLCHVVFFWHLFCFCRDYRGRQ